MGGKAGVGLEHAGEVLGILKSKFVCRFGYCLSAGDFGLCLLYYELPYVMPGIFAGQALDDVAEIYSIRIASCSLSHGVLSSLLIWRKIDSIS